ncbi:VapC toxin family PIN domain ribonuclease [Sphingobium sp. LB126]|uniref:type II toxin-antitoxin system VapC family toxin n=1 Tax=Sphingobium sp. LB126 TaxID=1983755 RepID=UPI000C209AED|nr:type II toxin-antitoxin system VapC family toxin [Sphingobium sp. LB126]PJG45913.1 VapC toxin family PIN domain ribonuclease [Sphingobium sp. LB126]
MKVTADTNILVRAATQDDPAQGFVARKLLSTAELVAVPLSALCEYCWVLKVGYKFTSAEIATSVRLLLNAGNVAMDRGAAEAGLALLDAGGDFADGVIAHDGQWLGADVFMSFDQKAVKLLQAAGQNAAHPE